MNPYSIDRLTDWAARILGTAGVPPEDALVAARLLVRSDLRGYRTHGLVRLPSYMDKLGSGECRARPDVRLDTGPMLWTMDADLALGQVAGQRLLEAAVPAMRSQPLLFVKLHNAGHLGALGIFALAAAEAGLMCMLGQRTPPMLALPGFRRPAIGHNPFAFGCPAAGDRGPLVFDMACSVAARGHILMAAREGQEIPSGWALDARGRPTTDAQAAADGMLQPAGGYKGMGLAMMIECLAAALPATPASNSRILMEMPRDGAMGGQSAFFFFLNPALAGDADAFRAYMDNWMAHYRASGAPEQARIPGERGAHAERTGRATGLAYGKATEEALRRLGERHGIALTPSSAKEAR